jgi:hypothetical protein
MALLFRDLPDIDRHANGTMPAGLWLAGFTNMGVQMPPALRTAMRMRFGLQLDRHRDQAAVPHPALGDQTVREVADVISTAAQHRYFKATIVIEMHVHRG